MELVQKFLTYFLSFQPFVLLPVIIFIMALIFRMKIATALRSALTLGIGFIGIFMTFDFFVKIIKPVIEAFILRTGMNMPVLDTGWPPLARIAWTYELAPLLLVIFIAINIVMLLTRLTKTVNIDIWNYWHVIFLAVLIQFMTNSVVLAVTISSMSFILTLKLAEWSAPLVNKISGMKGICIPHLSAIIHFPVALVSDYIIGKIPFLRSVKADPEHIRKNLGLAGEPMIIGFVTGLFLGIAGGYEIRELLTLAVSFSAVVFILPKMGEILGSALIPVSEGMKKFINKNFPHIGTSYIGLDVAVLFGIPAVLVTALFLMPASIVLAVILPKINFIPIGDLTNLLVPSAIIVTAARGNIVRSVMIGIPVVIANLYYASYYAPVLTEMSVKYNNKIEGYDGLFTSFLDGGNIYRAWMAEATTGDLVSIAAIPLVIILLIITWKLKNHSDYKAE
ncbi:MAG TPA: PTS transporter subunit IIC [Spirochaetota bacterium]|nr:PTS transporter subunit IIC [Spirochaetota bacterium]